MAEAYRQASVRHHRGVCCRHAGAGGQSRVIQRFLAAGLAWGVWREEPAVQLFFLGCVLVAGVFGGLTASRKILRVQALPALVAILVMLWAH